MRLVIRKVQYAPEKPGPQPTAETTRQFLMSDKPLHLEASLDKEVRAPAQPARTSTTGPMCQCDPLLPLVDTCARSGGVTGTLLKVNRHPKQIWYVS